MCALRITPSPSSSIPAVARWPLSRPEHRRGPGWRLDDICCPPSGGEPGQTVGLRPTSRREQRNLSGETRVRSLVSSNYLAISNSHTPTLIITVKCPYGLSVVGSFKKRHRKSVSPSLCKNGIFHTYSHLPIATSRILFPRHVIVLVSGLVQSGNKRVAKETGSQYRSS